MPAHDEVMVRPATDADADAVAALHVASWRSAYRGILSDAYLDGPIAGERLALWRSRFAAPDALVVEIAEADGRLIAFAGLLADHDPDHGTLIDNLHADPAARGGGLGARVLASALARLPSRAQTRPVHLTVFVANETARAVYGRWGGRESPPFHKREPDGREHDILRVDWPSAETLRERLAARAS